jgi:hypothetical protein|tara:strand:- start:4409 stop:5092 length:684 start_codon:yes stop_codon:yes gene_type:complete
MPIQRINQYKTLQESGSLKAFYDDIVYLEIASGRNRFYVTFMKGLYSVSNNKMESIGTAEINFPKVSNFTGSTNSYLGNRAGAGYDAFLQEDEITTGTAKEPNNGFITATELRGTRGFQSTITSSVSTTRTFHYELFDGQTFEATRTYDCAYFYPFSSHQLSVLRDEPTIIINLRKESECFNGIGEKGFVIVPEDAHQKVRDNLDFYLEKAGLIDKTTRARAPERGR